ncbi:Cysteine dioxygenase [Mortierella alpina]|uniref:Cysteine dioxygenase n=1 Tax=Mortierella alpina TaxID=64518 RepID=A0A9P6M4G1_MORAP|nr:Cysteine dioxygenase [Mortierella alpina]
MTSILNSSTAAPSMNATMSLPVAPVLSQEKSTSESFSSMHTPTALSNKDPVPVPTDLDDLVRLLHIELGANGLDSEGVDVDRVQKLMANYTSNQADWAKYALFDKGRYTRNLVDDGNGKFNLMILAWPETIGSDNSDDEEKASPAAAMSVKKETILKRDTVAYMHDKLGLHAVANPLKTTGSVSLHLYTPPYETCKTFNERSSKARSSGKCVFYSSRGQKLESCPSATYLKCSLTNTQ